MVKTGSDLRDLMAAGVMRLRTLKQELWKGWYAKTMREEVCLVIF